MSLHLKLYDHFPIDQKFDFTLKQLESVGNVCFDQVDCHLDQHQITERAFVNDLLVFISLFHSVNIFIFI